MIRVGGVEIGTRILRHVGLCALAATLVISALTR